MGFCLLVHGGPIGRGFLPIPFYHPVVKPVEVVAHFQYHFALECIPIRYKEVHLVNDSLMLSAFWTLIKNFLSAKVKSRIFFHSTGETLLNHFPRSVLPAKYGGDLTDWFQEDLVKRLNKEYGSCPLGGQNNFY
ncbi:alpha-tocopherol transfer protein [Trichonephila inaurata madagascariensis]|uniref:Alpha-tocopherol transfer protein n=1 Tax=Trichonephila inaurata madagascariensis TaxID=2747483 RepID=A0A8X7BU48_9ARAC|nr:alpha-tocopherol transfer protein [Trichonephila inaurata madagascariensis]